MFDFHMHSSVSFDSREPAGNMVQAALARGLREICFTDHVDYDPAVTEQIMVFDTRRYHETYDDLTAPGLKIRRGMEFGLTPDNQAQLRRELSRGPFDFVLGSVHFVDGMDVYLEPYWQGREVEDAYRDFLEQTLACVEAHTDYDVLAHLTFISKARGNPSHQLIDYREHSRIVDEILRQLVRHGKGLEMNTSGVDKCGGFLPTADFFRRFRELGGEIVTIGSDAHDARRVGQYTGEACRILKDIFDYVCTFQDREPIFHRL